MVQPSAFAQTEVSLSLLLVIASVGAAHRIEELNRSSVSGVTARSSVARPFGQQEESNLIADILLYIFLGWGRVSRPHRSEAVMLVALCPAVRPALCFGAVVCRLGNVSLLYPPLRL